MHLIAAFLHLQRLWHSFLHPHETNSKLVLDASGSVVQCGWYRPSLVLIHPQLLGEGSTGCGISVWPPDMTTLEGSPLDMLYQCCRCWWNLLLRGLLCKEFLPGYVDISAGACSVMHEYEKFLNDLHAAFWYLSGRTYQSQQCISQLWQRIPGNPWNFLSMSTN